MISNILTSSEQDAMDIFRESVSIAVCLPTQRTVDINANATRQELEERDKDSSEPDLAPKSLDLLAMTQVVRSQITYLVELQQIFQNSYTDLNPRIHRNQYPIPFMDNHEEKMREAIQSLSGIIAERERFYQELGAMMRELDLLRAIVVTFPSPLYLCRESLMV